MHTTQRLECTTLDRIREHGKLGDSFDSVLVKMLDKVENVQVEDHD